MKYKVEAICFGEIKYDLGPDGIYYSYPRAFERVVVDNEIKYRDLSGKKTYNNNSARVGIKEKASLASVMNDYSKEYVSRSMIKLYLLKYMAKNAKSKKLYFKDGEIVEKSK